MTFTKLSWLGLLMLLWKHTACYHLKSLSSSDERWSSQKHDALGYTLAVSEFSATHDIAVGHCQQRFNGSMMEIASPKDLELLKSALEKRRLIGSVPFHVGTALKPTTLSSGHHKGYITLAQTSNGPVTAGVRRKCTSLRFSNINRPIFITVDCSSKLYFVCQVPQKIRKSKGKRETAYSFIFAQKNILNLFQPTPFDATSCQPVIMNNYENSLASRVVGGHAVLYGSHPWQVEIALVKHGRREHHCSGVIIAERFILSTAHCFKRTHDKYLQSLRVITGDHNIELRDQHESEYEIDSVAIHPKHMASLYANDIALLKLKPKLNRGIAYGSHVKPVCMPEHDTDHIPGTTCVVSGWGFTEDSLMANISTVLQSAQVQLLSTVQCRDLYKNYNPVSDGMLCAGHVQGGVDSCHGDSGGPLVCNVSDTMYLFGLVSWGDGCALPNRPGVYVRVQHYLKWIKDTIDEMS